MKQMNELDYVEFYAKNLLEDNKFFNQQKELIDAQINGNVSLFKNTFGKGKCFKKNARIYLRQIGLI